MKRIYIFSLICFAFFLLNLMLLRYLSLPDFFSSYFNDLLCLPVVLGVCHYLIRSFSTNEQLRISLFSALSLAALYSVYFEVYLPDVTERYTADIFDALLYFTGSFIFYLFQEKTIQDSKKFSDKTNIFSKGYDAGAGGADG